MADPFSDWMSAQSLVGNSTDNSEFFMENRPNGPRYTIFQNEVNNLNQLAKLYRNVPVYGTGPLTDDEKREIVRRNNEEVENQQEGAQQTNANE